MQRTNTTTVFLLASGAISLYLCFLIARPFLESVFVAVVIAVVCRPLNSFIQKHIKGQNAAALISTILVLVLIITPVITLGLAVKREITQLYQSFDKSQGQGGWNQFAAKSIDDLVAWVGKYVPVSVDNLRSGLTQSLKDISRPLLSFGARALSNVFGFIANTVVTFFTLFYFFREGRSMKENLVSILPLNSGQAERLLTGIDNSIIANVHGCAAVALAQGTLAGLAFWVLGVPSPVLWAIATGLFSMVPVVGSGAIWGPAAIILIVNGHLWKGVALFIWGAAIIAQADNVVRPFVISKRAAMHPLMIFFSLLGGVAAFGVIGLFVGPIVLSVTIVVLDMLREMNSQTSDSLSLTATNLPESSQPPL